MITGHGDDYYNYKNSIISNFSSNIYCHADTLKLKQFISEHLNFISFYPHPGAEPLQKAIAEKFKIDINNVCITNGATEAIYIIAKTFQESYSTIVIPTFSEYHDACFSYKHRINEISDIDKIPSDTQIVWICNPNNPTGMVYGKDILKQMIKNNPHIYYVIDQSYEAFTEKPLFTIKEAITYPNVILLHSMTKKYAIPGLRLGYVTAHANIIKELKNNCIPWSVNGLAIAAGHYLLQNTQDLPLSNYLRETNRLRNALNEIEGIEVFPSDCHILLCRLKNNQASVFKNYLANKGILIRDASNFKGLNNAYFRIATQSTEENDLLIKAVKEWEEHL